VRQLINRIIKTGETRGYVNNWIGRRCHINNRNFAYKLPNHLIQGGAADVIKLAMPKIHELLLPVRSKMVVQIHDDILHEIHMNELELVPKIKDIMENIYVPKNGMKLTVSPEISKNSWAYRDFEKLTC
jgi:DNA polymerase-1